MLRVRGARRAVRGRGARALARRGPSRALRSLAALAARLAETGPPDRAVRAAAQRLGDPRQRIDGRAADLGPSERQLRRRCLPAVGYGPKVLQRILRFRRFVAAAGADLARLAAEAGYADQAHLTRGSGELAGLTPAALVTVRSSAPRA